MINWCLQWEEVPSTNHTPCSLPWHWSGRLLGGCAHSISSCAYLCSKIKAFLPSSKAYGTLECFNRLHQRPFFNIEPRVIVSHPVKRKKPGMHGLSCYVPWRPRRYAFQFKNLKMQTATGTIIINEMVYDSSTQIGRARSILEDCTLYWHNLVWNDFSASH